MRYTSSMLPYRDSRITKIALIIFFLILAAYAYYEARGLLFGPRIEVPAGKTEVHEALVNIRGTASRIASLSLNGKAISVTENGVFEEPYLLAEGYNRIVLDATDKYSRKSRKVIEIVYTPSTDSTSSPQASSGQAPIATTTVTNDFASTTPVAR